MSGTTDDPRPATRPADPSGRTVLGCFVLLAVAAYGALLGLVLMYSAAFRCDESCSPSTGAGWRSDEMSSMWDALGAGGPFAVVLAIVVTVAVFVRPARAGAWAPAAAIAIIGALAPLVWPDASERYAVPLGEAAAVAVALAVYAAWRLTRTLDSASDGRPR